LFGSVLVPHKDRVHPPISQIPPILKTKAGLSSDCFFEIGVICGSSYFARFETKARAATDSVTKGRTHQLPIEYANPVGM